MTLVTIISPAYNEAAVLPAFNAALFRVIDGLSDRYQFEVIYVLDRSRDDSLSVLTELAKRDSRITVLHLSRRFGHQMSLVAGLDHSRGDAIIMMDCDLQHPPELVIQLLEAFEKGYDVVHAIRRYDRRTGYAKQLTSRLFYKLQNWLSPVRIEEGSADFRLVSRKVGDVFRTGIREQNQFLRGLFRWVGYSSTEVYYECRPRAGGSTKYRFRRLLSFSIQGITSFSKVPLRIATALGILLSLATTLYGTWSLIGFFFTRQLPPGYTSLIVAVMWVGGLQLLVLGVLGEYLGAIFDETKARPLYLIDAVIRSGATMPPPAGAPGPPQWSALTARNSR